MKYRVTVKYDVIATDSQQAIQTLAHWCADARFQNLDRISENMGQEPMVKEVDVEVEDLGNALTLQYT